MDKKNINDIVLANLKPNSCLASISMADIPNTDSRMLQLYAMDIAFAFTRITGIDWNYEMCYTEKKIFLYREDVIMHSEFVISIPYGERSKYFDDILKINALVGADGRCALFVNNSPYKLEAVFAIETEQNEAAISEIIKEANLSILEEKGLDELNAEIVKRKWNALLFPENGCITKKEIAEGFFYSEKDTLRQKGYDVDADVRRKKVFISYCHKDRQIVIDIVAKLKRAGLYVWIDEQEIDIGDNILQSISDGIRECDLAILFLSSNTLNAGMARHEIISFLQKAIYHQKKIAPIVLDDVDVNEIMEGLGNYNYFLYKDESQIEELVQKLKRKIK